MKIRYFKFKKNIIPKIIVYLMGIFVTMPIVTIYLMRRKVSVFTLLFLIVLVYLFYKFITERKSLLIMKEDILIITWLYLSFIASLFGIIYFSSMPEWINSISRYIPKILLYLLFAIMLIKSSEKKNIIVFFMKGFIFGIILNLIWVNIEGFAYYSFGFSLNNRIFTDYITTLSANRQFISIIRHGAIRASGFNYDPAHIGGLAPILILYSLLNKKQILLLLTLGAIIFSQSTTALISSVILVFLNYKSIFNISNKVVMRGVVKKTFTVFIALLMIFLLITNSNFVSSITSNVTHFVDRVTKVYINEWNTNIRLIYHLLLPEAVVFSGIKALTGTGYGTASYPYIFSDNINRRITESHRPFDPESTYISYLFDIGIIGLFIYLLILIRGYRYHKKRISKDINMLIYISLSGIIISGFFYHYILTAYQVIIISMSMIYMSYQKREEKIQI